MRFLILFMALLASACDERQALCDKEVEAAMKGKPSYKLLEIIPDWQEYNREGEGIVSFKYLYRYQPSGYGSDFRFGVLRCSHVDGDKRAEVYYKKEIK